MKKLLQILITLLIPFAISAQQTEVNGIKFKLNSDEENSCYVSGYVGTESEIIIPETVIIDGKEYTVTKIGEDAFFKNFNINKIQLPSSIKLIDKNAFYHCEHLQNINLPNGLEVIEQFAFEHTHLLVSIKIPASVTKIGKYAFSDCLYLRSLEFEDSEIELDMVDAFKNYENLGSAIKYLYIGRNIPSMINGLSTQHLETLTIGEHVDDLSGLKISKFNDKLKQIICNPANPPVIGNVDSEVYSRTNLVVRKSSLDNYINNPIWAFFKKIVTIDFPLEDYEISINPEKIILQKGQTAILNGYIHPEIDIKPFFVKEFSLGHEYSNSSYYITGNELCETEAYFILPINGKRAYCHVTVKNDPTNIVINRTSLDFSKGESLQLYVNITPNDATDQTITWISTNSSVASVEDGLVTAVGGGECDIVATTHNGLEAKCHVTVSVNPESIWFELPEISAEPGDKITLIANLSPEDITENKLTWTSSDTNIAIVNDGTVTCKGTGQVNITATTVNGLSAECKIIINPVIAESMYIDETDVEIKIGSHYPLEAIFYPENTTNKSVTWSSSDTNVVTVNSIGLIYGVDVGEAIITATTSNDLTATCTVKVSPIYVESITVSPSIIEEVEGNSVQLSTTVLPENATCKVLEWTSDNESVATVDENGLVTIISGNSTIIHAESTDGSGVEGTCEVTGIAGVEALLADGKQWNVFTSEGILIRKNVTIEEIRQLAPAIYIISDGTRTLKLVR